MEFDAHPTAGWLYTPPTPYVDFEGGRKGGAVRNTRYSIEAPHLVFIQRSHFLGQVWRLTGLFLPVFRPSVCELFAIIAHSSRLQHENNLPCLVPN